MHVNTDITIHAFSGNELVHGFRASISIGYHEETCLHLAHHRGELTCRHFLRLCSGLYTTGERRRVWGSEGCWGGLLSSTIHDLWIVDMQWVKVATGYAERLPLSGRHGLRENMLVEQW